METEQVKAKAFPFDAVIFDMDGVIVDTEYFYVCELREFARELGIPVTEQELQAARRYVKGR